MLAYRLVRLIETHSDRLAGTLLERVQGSEILRDYQKVPTEELKTRVYEIYRHLGDWLLGKTEFDIEQRYVEIGERRAQQGVPLSQVVWTIIQTKENLWDFLKREAVLDRPVEIFGELELLQMLEQFFERAIYYATIGYEQAKKRRMSDRRRQAMSWEIEYKKKLRTPQRSVALRAVGHAGIYPAGLRRAGDAGRSADGARARCGRCRNRPHDDDGNARPMWRRRWQATSGTTPCSSAATCGTRSTTAGPTTRRFI